MNVATCDFTLEPDCGRVLLRPFVQVDLEHVTGIISRTLALTDQETDSQLAAILHEFGGRHRNIEKTWLRQFKSVEPYVFPNEKLSSNRRLLIGALFTGEYAFEGAALFNPSIVPHPDQTGLGDNELRFVMSLRATGEGHISSIEFRTGVVRQDFSVQLDTVQPFAEEAELIENPTFPKSIFEAELRDAGLENEWSKALLASLAEIFALQELVKAVETAFGSDEPDSEINEILACLRALVRSNYETRFDPSLSISQRIVFPVSPGESSGIEDARFVRFTGHNGASVYYATYTAFNGRKVLPQLIETDDFLHFRFRTLQGTGAQNKGMALFPRRIGKSYAMLSRFDDENLFLLSSDDLYFWSGPRPLLQPKYFWESIKIGNCGSPIETDEGWLVLTHGVGPMRKYSLGAVLLDLDDPSKIIGRLSSPLIQTGTDDWSGYVPSVIYTCGGLVHRGRLLLPYAKNDRVTTIATIELARVLSAIKRE